ncbi:MAG TPA: DegT/DnrJ/EryC1/StrS family aminotransferase [Actinomycetota bacterium]|nr:DegT/DnrJ/EryC1/StrS family aminotransferase [Actinomycetota bacterium]
MTTHDAGTPVTVGGRPAFPDGLPLVRPSIPDAGALAEDLRAILESRVLTNGPFVSELERRAAEYLGVRHCIAVASCTAGLMLVLRAAGLSGDAVVPSFTFAATAHAAAWNGLRPVFADVDRDTLTLDADAVRRAATPATSGVIATHTYGTPCDVEALERVAADLGVPLFFDAAHAFGSRHRDVPVGRYGAAEVFSLSPTKVVVAGEGGIIATDDDELAERCRIGRDYGNPGNYDFAFVGLNARMSEIHAAMALRSLDPLEERVERRNVLARRYREALSDVPGISFPAVRPGDRSTFKDLAVLVEPGRFGADATTLGRALAGEGIDTRRYYSPPVHRVTAYRGVGPQPELPVTEWAAERALALPMWSEMTDDQPAAVGTAVRRIRSTVTGA